LCDINRNNNNGSRKLLSNPVQLEIATLLLEPHSPLGWWLLNQKIAEVQGLPLAILHIAPRRFWQVGGSSSLKSPLSDEAIVSQRREAKDSSISMKKFSPISMKSFHSLVF
jgi:hypothetical protein